MRVRHLPAKRRFRLGLFGLLTSFVTFGLFVTASAVFDSAFAADSTPSLTGERSQFVGVRKCQMCHDRRTQDHESPLDKEFGLTEFVKLSELHTWYEKDKHAQAFKVLSNPVGQQIGKALGIDNQADRRCLSCHAISHGGGAFAAQELRLGVTCEACHGAASRWFMAHMDPPWRNRSAGEKEQLGMIDMRNLLRRNRQCLSCHVGNWGDEKIVTHEMYAAGHPPLPGVEVETFVSEMPKHWQALNDKSDSIKKLMRFDPLERRRTKSVVLSAVLVLRESMQLLGARAAATTEGKWPDFALYDCAGCHHNLRPSSWRQQRGYQEVAGRPQVPDWPRALVKLALNHTSNDAIEYQRRLQEFNEKFRKLHEIINAKVFGDLEKLGDYKTRSGIIGELLQWLDQLVSRIDSSRFDRNATLRLLQRLTVLRESGEPESYAYPDHDSARQIAWAIISLVQDLDLSPERAAEIDSVISQIKTNVDVKITGVNDTASGYSPERFAEQLARLSKILDR